MSSSLILHNNNEPFLHQIVTCDKKWIMYDNQPVQWLDQEEAPKHFSKPNMHWKRSWSLFGGLLQSDPLQLSESWWNYYIWEVCSVNQWDAPKTAMPATSIGQQNGPNSLPRHITQPTLQELNELDYEVLLHLPDSPDLSWTNYYFFKYLDNSFADKTLPQPARGRKYSPRVRRIQKHHFLYYRNNKLISRWQKCFGCNSFD